MSGVVDSLDAADASEAERSMSGAVQQHALGDRSDLPAQEPVGVRNPRTGEIDHWISPPSKAEVAAYADSLREQQVAWALAGLEHRIRVLLRWADALERRGAEIGVAEMTDTGRSRVAREAPYRVARSVRGWCAVAPGLIERARLSGVASGASFVTYTTELDPYPLVGIISPWNHPFLLSAIDVVPALIAGCAAIVKPSEVTPRFVDPVALSIQDVPELSAVLRYVVGGAETGQAIIGVVDALCFTGSVATGRSLAEACARRFIPAFLELGGNDAAIVAASADLSRAVPAILRGAVHNTGQQCFATERVYVDSTVYDEFVVELVKQANALRLNFPEIDRGDIGPFILGRQAAIVDRQLDDALARGARLECGGASEVLGGGLYMRATVLTDVNHEMEIMREETFGPVVPVMPFRTNDDAIELANDTEFGLSGAVFAGEREEAAAIAVRMKGGAISIQDTGLHTYILRDVEKMAYGVSGLGGSRMGPNGLLRFLRRKALLWSDGDVIDMGELSERPAP